MEEEQRQENGGCDACVVRDEPLRAAAGGWLRDLLVAMCVLMFIILFLYQPVRVEGVSMLPQLEDDDRLFINKFVYSHAGEMVGASIHRGDVVVFEFPRDVTKSYIKRVVALPGDTVQINHGQVVVNGQPLAEPYVPPRYEDDRSFAPVTMAAEQYFVLGDHRSIASDSRDFGPVERKLIYGRAALVYWPLDQAGVVR